MTLLQLVQALHREGSFPGTAPAGVASVTGRAADLVQWIIEAYNDIQREKDGKWKWLRSAWSLETTASDADYAYTEVTDVAAAAAISRFRSWDLDEDDPPHIYLTADGASTERELLLLPQWSDFRYLYQRGTHTAAYPVHIARDHRDVLFFGPTPDDAYTASGFYWKGNQALAVDGDTPEMPADYHMLIVFRALEKYGYNRVAREKIARAAREGTALWDALSLNQGWDRETLVIGPALA